MIVQLGIISQPVVTACSRFTWVIFSVVDPDLDLVGSAVYGQIWIRIVTEKTGIRNGSGLHKEQPKYKGQNISFFLIFYYIYRT